MPGFSGDDDGSRVGDSDGCELRGDNEGLADGGVGLVDGEAVGSLVGLRVGRPLVGNCVGRPVG